MLKRSLLTAALLFALAFPAYAQETPEPTAEATPVVVDSAPVVIPDDSTVIVIEAPLPEEPTDAAGEETPGGYALVILATAVIMTIVFTPVAYFLAKSIPSSVVPILVSQGRTLITSGQDYAKTTLTPLDDLAFNELAKGFDRLEKNVTELQRDMQNLTPGK